MSMNLSISGHTLVMESLKLGPRVKLFESFSSLNALSLICRDFRKTAAEKVNLRYRFANRLFFGYYYFDIF